MLLAMILTAASLLAIAVVWLIVSRRALARAKRRLAEDFRLLQGHNDRLSEELRASRARRDETASMPFDPIAAVTEPDIEIRTRAILNAGERHVLAACDAFVATRAPGQCRVFAQVSLGELLIASSRDPVLCDRAFRAFNAKRPDIVIVDAAGLPLAAVEYQGAGHDQGDALLRDAVKRAACQRAGIAYIEIAAAATTLEIHAALEQHLGPRLDLLSQVR